MTSRSQEGREHEGLCSMTHPHTRIPSISPHHPCSSRSHTCTHVHTILSSRCSQTSGQKNSGGEEEVRTMMFTIKNLCGPRDGDVGWRLSATATNRTVGTGEGGGRGGQLRQRRGGAIEGLHWDGSRAPELRREPVPKVCACACTCECVPQGALQYSIQIRRN